MPRKIKIAAAQVGTVHRTSPREETLSRLLQLLGDAASQGAEVVLFPETTFTTFFPRYLIEDEAELQSFFEHGDVATAPNTKPLFDKARELGVDISVGLGEATEDGQHFNTSIYYHSKTGSILSKYRKIHLPGDFEPFKDPNAVNQLEKRYFLPGNLGFNAFRVPKLASNSEPIFGMMICNDRRWPEAWRCLGLQGVEVVLCGYNTAGFAPHLWGADVSQTPEAAEADALFHHKLTMQSNSYMNATFSVCAARCGMDDDKYNLIGGSCIIDPEGKILAEAKTKGDEVVFAEIDLDACRQGKTRTFDFARHRRVEHYGRIVGQTGVVEPPRLGGGTTTRSTNGTTTTNGDPTAITNEGTPKKKVNILLLNPNSTPSMTTTCLTTAQPTLPPDVHLTPFTAPAKLSPSAIESSFDAIFSASACARTLLADPNLPSYDGILVACYSEHPLIKLLREELEIPVMGIMQASILFASTLGARYGLIATSQRSKGNHALHLAHDTSCAGISSVDLGVLDLERLPREVVMAKMRSAAEELIAQGAEVLLLGCAGMSGMKEALEEAVSGRGVEVVDGVVAGVQILSGVVRMGGRTAKGGVFRSSKVVREGRGDGFV
ncbi:hypothetical protein M409DRAFT_68733 [Zasmidium cellare ATCC 36951]|uniref:CN hydrolase domain-containing protein n=1 Tax=Zasmidium cellare ATCC 36951 TaxID=1080233 RepID=A0A6A6C7T8_ZASCE|nr:uncharacterized protein M409DRAFT_68733 [Zasmidium cellare ATCC 36951]KAF2163111.1 hypothetical protein M409DRAFT_68733 [Zasmidium cellare ATCC 36951]